jgi:hypothetical protein
MSNKTKIERKILDLVYKSQETFTIFHQDKPDFLITNNVGDTFGVEITQLFTNESDARLKNIPNYTEELLDKKKYRHKNDIKVLKVENILIEKPDGRKIETEAIIQKSPQPKDYLQKLISIIESKNKLKEEYSKDISHTNLIIHDNSDIFSLRNPDDFYNDLYTEEVAKAIVQNDFHEIFLITRFKPKMEIFRLKLIYLSSRIYFFNEILKANKITNITDELYYNSLAEYLSFEGFRNIRMKMFNGETEIIYGNIGFTVKDYSDLVFRDYGDYNFKDGELLIISTPKFITKEVEDSILEIKKTFGFSTNIGLVR